MSKSRKTRIPQNNDLNGPFSGVESGPLSFLPHADHPVPAVIRRLKLPAGKPTGDLFAWFADRVQGHRWNVRRSKALLKHEDQARRQRKAETMRRYRAKLRAARPDLKALWKAREG
jgi:hypothetical protein